MPVYGLKPSGDTVLNSCGFSGAEVTGHKLLPVIIGRHSCICLMKTTVWKIHLVVCVAAWHNVLWLKVGNRARIEFVGYGERPVSKTFHP